MASELFDVVSVECLEGHLLRLHFEDGFERVFDMEPWFSRRPFQVLKQTPLFNQARVEYGTVVWPGDIDIDPETLRNGSKPNHYGDSSSCSAEAVLGYCAAEEPVKYGEKG